MFVVRQRSALEDFCGGLDLKKVKRAKRVSHSRWSFQRSPNVTCFKVQAMSVLSTRSDIQLPTELLLIIINELGLDAKALASCRLASYVLCSLTTPLFFSSLALWEDSKAIFQGEFERARNLNKLLSNPDIADLVHTFTLRCGKRFLEDPKIGLLIFKILYRLPHIQTFRFYGDGDFSPFPRDISSAIQVLCKSPNLTTLELDNIRFLPIRVITACPNLRFLHLLRVEFNVIFIPILSIVANFVPVRQRDFNG